MKAEKFRKKPIEVEVMQWDGSDESNEDIQRWTSGKAWPSRRTEVYKSEDGLKRIRGWFVLRIRTAEGTMWANIGDYIIRGIYGEFYPCTPHVFEATYEKI